MYGPDHFSRDLNVSREITVDFCTWQKLLSHWNKTINLVSPAALAEFWQRHALDSAQLFDYIPKGAKRAIDLGSGGGFPGLALGIYFKHTGEGSVTLVESVGKKCNFLRTVTRELNLPVIVKQARAESLQAESYDLITARAFAPLPRLFDYAQPFWGEGTQALFLKGESVDQELTEASGTWTFDTERLPSRSDPNGYILRVNNLRRQVSDTAKASL